MLAAELSAVTNVPAPAASDDFEALIEETGFDVTGAVTVTVVNDSTDRVTFQLEFAGTSSGVDATYDLNYDYNRE